MTEYFEQNVTVGSYDVLKPGKASLYCLRGCQLPFGQMSERLFVVKFVFMIIVETSMRC